MSCRPFRRSAAVPTHPILRVAPRTVSAAAPLLLTSLIAIYRQKFHSTLVNGSGRRSEGRHPEFGKGGLRASPVAPGPRTVSVRRRPLTPHILNRDLQIEISLHFTSPPSSPQVRRGLSPSRPRPPGAAPRPWAVARARACARPRAPAPPRPGRPRLRLPGEGGREGARRRPASSGEGAGMHRALCTASGSVRRSLPSVSRKHPMTP